MPGPHKSGAMPPLLHCTHCKFTLADGEQVQVASGGNLYHTRCVGPANRKARGLVHPCPQCDQRGVVPDPEHARTERRSVPAERDARGNYECAYGGCMGCTVCSTGFETKEVQVVPDKSCPLCKGEGWLSRPAVPITEVVVKGWRLE